MFSNGFPKEWSTLRKLAWLYRTVINAVSAVLKTVTGNPIHILDALAKPAQALSVKLEPIQDLHGYDAPWPSGGGKNLLPNKGNNGTYLTNVNVSYDSDNSVYTLNGTAAGSGSIYLVSIPNTEMVLSTEENYTLSCTVVSGSITIPTGTGNTYAFAVFNTGSSKFIRGAVNLTESGLDGYKATGAGFNTTLNYSFLLQLFRSGITFNNLKIRVQLEKGSTATAWTPYSNICPISGHTDADVIVSPTLNPLDGTTYPIPLSQTVYGGTLDVTSGVLTVDRAIVDMGTLNWIYYSAQQRIVAQVNSGKPAGANVGLDGACSVYKVVNTAYRQAPDKSIVIGNNFISNSYAAMVVHDENYTDAATFKTAVSGHTLVYPIKTPATYQLTPTEVTLLLGENNIWSDGEMTLVYLADGNASDVEALNILLGGRYVNNHEADEPTDREALDTLLGGTR